MDFATVFVSTIFGSGVATAIVAHFFRRSLETDLEAHRAILQRGTKIHELQVVALMKLYSHLHRGHELLRALHAPTEKRDERDRQFIACFFEAQAHLHEQRLLLPASLVVKVEELFHQLTDARMDLAFAFDPDSPGGEDRKILFDKFRHKAFTTLPELLRSIEQEGRQLIHGDAVAP